MNPLQTKIHGVFIPVSHIEHAKNWYCDLLGLSNQAPLYNEHLFVIQMSGVNLILDSKIYSDELVYKVPAFQIKTEDIEAAYNYMKQKNVKLLTEIENGHWFNFEDLDGNMLMVCM